MRKELCYWDTSTILEDYDMWLRLWQQKCRFYNVKSIEVLHRIHRESAFNAKGNNQMVSALREKYK